MLIDSHCHLDYEYDVPVEELIEEARRNGIGGMIAISAARGSLSRVRALAERHPEVWFSTGIHPHDAKDFDDSALSEMAEHVKHPRCVAVGELGLDFFYHLSDRKTQIAVLNRQLAFSVDVGKPVVVHTRESDAEIMDALENHSAAWQRRYPGRSPGVIHCFTGGRELAERCLALGYFVSFSGIITFKNADALRGVVRDVVPLQRMLVETDSPYLAPIPHRGKKNQPAWTLHVAEKVAELKGLSLSEVEMTTTENVAALFGIRC
ncbi:MAG: TatD family hydrolase [Bdellovibrionales bacterium]|nr:TatD family hydrolase [Bdellovibrionales bacterium]